MVQLFKHLITVIFVCVPAMGWANGERVSGDFTSGFSCESLPWKIVINQRGPLQEKKYPRERTINSKTLRLTLNEYYVPNVSEVLGKGVDYFEWLNQVDDPYLNRYKLDLELDAQDERLKLFWKRDF